MANHPPAFDIGPELLEHLRGSVRGQLDAPIRQVIGSVSIIRIIGQGARRFRNPDEDLLQDFDGRRSEYYIALKQPQEAHVFVEALRHRMETALANLDAYLPSNPKVKLTTTKKGKGRICLTPLDEQPEPRNIVALTAALVERWPMTNLLDILKETGVGA